MGPPALGLGQRGSVLLQPHTGRQGQKQWSEAFGRGPEGKYSLSSNGMDHFTAAAVTRWWCWDGSMGRPHTSRPLQQKKKKQKPPACIVHRHLCQMLRGGIKSLFGNIRAPYERWAERTESKTRQKRRTGSKHKGGFLVGSAGDEEENDAPPFNKPKPPVLTSCSCGVQIP